MILESPYRRDRLAPRLKKKVEFKAGELQGQEHKFSICSEVYFSEINTFQY